MISKVLFFGGLILIAIWVIAFFGFNAGGFYHVLPAIAIIALLVRLFYNKAITEPGDDDFI
jgi:hypothetical protein